MVKHRPIVADDYDGHLDVKEFMAKELTPAEWHKTLEDHGLHLERENDSQSHEGRQQAAAGQEKGDQDPEKKKVVLIDTRNWYESEVGKFTGAVPLGIDRYKEAFQALDTLLLKDDVNRKDTKVMMYCTGGIRCIKLGTYVRQRLGFEDVNQLRGGIIGYVNFIRAQGVQKTPRELVQLFSDDRTLSWLPGKTGADEPPRKCDPGNSKPDEGPKSHFLGKNFVFDERKGERVTEDVISKCHQCGSPSDIHRNCANPVCNILFIQCPTCHTQHHGACSSECFSVAQMDQAGQESYAKKFTQLKRLQNPAAFNKNIHVVRTRLGGSAAALPANNGTPAATMSGTPSSPPLHRAYSSALERTGIQEYCDKHSTPLVPLLRTLAAETQDLYPSSAHMMISPSQSMLFTILVSLVKAKNVLEIGCFTGFSALSLAQSLPAGGKLLSLEVDERVAEVARRYISKSYDLQERVRIQIGPAMESLRGLVGQDPFDVAFIDADKKNYLAYYNTLLEHGLVRRGGLILVDNVLAKGLVVDEALKGEQGQQGKNEEQPEAGKQGREQKRAKIMHEFNEQVLSDRRTRKVILPIRDGLTIMEVL